jgi:Fe-S cluster assembly protein SufD
MTLAQTKTALISVSGHGQVSAHTCRISGNKGEIALAGAGTLPLDAPALAELDELQLDVTADLVQVFIPLAASEKKLTVILNLATNTNTRLYLLARGPARNLQLIINAAEQACAAMFALLDDAAAHFIFEANVHSGSEVTFNGLTRTQGKTVTAIEVNVRHLSGNSRTDQKFYSYARDTSHISFTGRITVVPGASGTEAHQLHRGMALSPGARIDAQPFLNILHDDVRCTHGSTVGFIDKTALAYLMSRGLGRDVAERILIHSFERQFFDLMLSSEAREFYGVKGDEL